MWRRLADLWYEFTYRIWDRPLMQHGYKYDDLNDIEFDDEF